ncbi:MAG: hypothetical protein V4596_02380 [Bdellovibrionota bacterium]
MKQFFIVSILLISLNAFGLIVGPTTIEGKVKSFDEKNVIVITEENSISIPREFVPTENIKANQKIEVNLTEEQFNKVKIEKIKK